MTEEVLPRWGLPAVEFVETDPATIQSEIITGYEKAAGRTLAVGDPIRLFLLSIADVIIQQRACINISAKQNLLSYAEDEFLDALGQYLSVERLSESHAKTTIRFTLSQALGSVYTIPAGFEVTNGIVTFATDKELLIPIGQTTGDVSATCTTAGSEGNDYLSGQISTIVNPLTFLSSAANTTITTGGADAESNAEYADRIRLAPNSFSVAGPKKAYEYHAKSVSSAIIDVSVTSPYAGVVHVYPLLEGGTLPSTEVLNQIEEYLSSDTIRPLTDYVETLSPTAVPYTIRVDYWISESDRTNAESIRAAVEKAVEEYRVWQQSKIGRDILPDRLISNVIRAGAARIDSSVLSPSSFKKLEDNEVAQCPVSDVVINYKGYKEE